MFYRIESQNDSVIEVFYSYNSDPKEVEFNLSKRVSKTLNFPKQSYYKNLSISKEKSKDLFKLCSDGIIPSTFHQQYIDLILIESVVKCKRIQQTDEKNEVPFRRLKHRNVYKRQSRESKMVTKKPKAKKVHKKKNSK